jgi:DNA-binding LacI/PurR family transcriptional regulator
MDIITVARRARVSTATVSRVLNHATSVRASTAAQVRKVIEELGYIPNTSARVLRSGRSRLFGIVVSDIRNPFFPDLIENFESLAMQHGIDVIFANTGYNEERLFICVQRLMERGVDGIALMTSEVSQRVFAKFENLKMPVVFLNQPSVNGHFRNVKVDYVRGFRDAIEHLRQLGHKKIAFIAGPPSFSSAERRRKAFLAAIEACRLPFKAEWLLQGDHRALGGAQAMDRLLSLRNRPTAVVCSNDLTAIGVLQTALAKGLHLPKDFSLIGFDDLMLDEMLQPPLTTIHLSRKEIASRAFFALYANENPAVNPPRVSVVLPKLIIRGSTGPPRRR